MIRDLFSFNHILNSRHKNRENDVRNSFPTNVSLTLDESELVKNEGSSKLNEQQIFFFFFLAIILLQN